MNKLKLLSLLLLFSSQLLSIKDNDISLSGGAGGGEILKLTGSKRKQTELKLEELPEEILIKILQDNPNLARISKVSRSFNKIYKNIIKIKLPIIWPKLRDFTISVTPYVTKNIIPIDAKVEEIKEWLKNSKNSEAIKEALLYGITTNRYDIIKIASTIGIDTNNTDHNGNTEIMIAAEYGNTDTIKNLLELNANINATNEWGNTALTYAVSHNHIDAVIFLLDNGAKLHLTDNGSSELTVATKFGYTDIVKALLENGADIPTNLSAYSNKMRTILSEAQNSRVIFKDDHKESSSKGAGGY